MELFDSLFKWKRDDERIQLARKLAMEKSQKCECCNKFPVMYELRDVYRTSTGTTYKVCVNCLIGLVNYSLSKEQYRNLIDNGHVSSEFLLHEDFYDENGDAVQPLFT